MTTPPTFLPYHSEPLDLGDPGGFRRRHVFEAADVDAVNAALAARRPLLLRGKPGTGKSQLALAAAVGLGRAFVSRVIDAREESRDLLWRFDAVRRLADAQAAAAGASAARLAARRKKWLEGREDLDILDESFYIEPGPLWWAFNWQSALKQAEKAGSAPPSVRPGCDPQHGVVVLLDEIDKADSSLPNGLLGALGDGVFSVPGHGEVRCQGVRPLVVITTNEERSLPAAFLRRCAVHELALPKAPEKLEEWLIRLGEAHFEELGGGALEEAAKILLGDRETCRRLDLPLPGGAEYLDLLRAVEERLAEEGKVPKKVREKRIVEVLGIARRFLVLKDPDAWEAHLNQQQKESE